MENIDVSQIQDLNNVMLVDKNADISTLKHDKVNFLDWFDSHLNELIYYSGRDNFIVKKNRILAGEYQSIVNEYDELYKSGKIVNEELKGIAFEYEDRILAGSRVLYFDNGIYSVLSDGNNDTFSVVMSLNEKFNHEEHPIISEYFSKSKKLVRELK